MTIAYLNGEFLPLEEARISPMDRGFLFGDGVYEVVPCYQGRLIAMDLHLARLRNSLDGISLAFPSTDESITEILQALCQKNDGEHQGVYLQITRGTAMKRQHAFPNPIKPTLFAYTFPIGPPSDGSPETASCYTAVTRADQRWGRCHIKSVALLGNVLHMMEAIDEGAEEVLLFNEQDQLTEAAACNVFIVSNGVVLTPELDNQKLPGVTRHQLLDFMARYTDWQVEVRPVSKQEVLGAEEIWLTSSTKEVAPVVSLDGRSVGDGTPGPRWSAAQKLFEQHRFDGN